MNSQFSIRFWSKVALTANPARCWNWLAGTDGFYGMFKVGGNKRAHRVAYELLVGPIPTGLVLDHRCRNKRCVNPAHLRAGTQRDNMNAPGIDWHTNNARLAKTHCPQGHEYSVANTYSSPSRTERQCRICRAEHKFQYEERQKLHG